MKAITPINNNGSIQLKFQVSGKRYGFSPIKGSCFDNANDIKKAQSIALIIQLDIESGNFDATLDRYKANNPNAIAIKVAESAKAMKAVKVSKVDLIELWDKYIAHKRPSVSPSTYKATYVRLMVNCLKTLPTTDIYDAVVIRDYLIGNKTVKSTKRILMQINACLNWALDSGLVESNPFIGMTSKIKLPKGTETEDINPYNAVERDTIIEGFRQNKYYSRYAPLVEFIFNVGCRPSEALSLQWKDYSKGQINFDSAFVTGCDQPNLKTQAKRTINLNKKVIAMLDSIKPDNCDVLALIFPNTTGLHIDWNNFASRVWVKTLAKLPNIEYRNPYQMRHTFITLAIKNAVSLTDIAKSCGNSPKMILESYAGVTRDFVMPEF